MLFHLILITVYLMNPTFVYIKKINIEIDKLLLADIQNNRSDGESFNEIKQKIHDKKSSNDWPQTTRNNPNDYEEDIHDSNKLLLLYAQIHHIANKNQGKQITFDFYDDNTQIVQSLYNFFSNNPKAIPNNINLCIHQYGNIQVGNQLNERETLFHFRPIQGTGEVDTEYKKTIQEIPLSAAVKFYQSKKNIEVAQDDIKARADTIKYAKETNKCLATFITYDDIRKISYSFDLKKNVDFLKSQLDGASTTNSKRYLIGLDNESYFVSKEMYNKCKPYTAFKDFTYKHQRVIDISCIQSDDFIEKFLEAKTSAKANNHTLHFPKKLFNQTASIGCKRLDRYYKVSI